MLVETRLREQCSSQRQDGSSIFPYRTYSLFSVALLQINSPGQGWLLFWVFGITAEYKERANLLGTHRHVSIGTRLDHSVKADLQVSRGFEDGIGHLQKWMLLTA